MMITGDESLWQISEMGDKLISVFEKQGLGNYFTPDNLNKTGKFIRLNSLLQGKKIERSLFIASLNQLLEDQSLLEPKTLIQVQQSLHFAAMLPCGLRNSFKEYFESYVLENPDRYKALNYLIEGNVNHELSYYPLLDSLTDIHELPDIIMASDVNHFFHKPFMTRFVKNGIFNAYTPYSPNTFLEKAGYSDPAGNFTLFTANLLVMVVDKKRLGKRKMPRTWNDLLDISFENEIIMRGEEDFFCNAILLPFYKENGFKSIERLAMNIKSGLHPAEMVKLAGTDKKEGATVYIMPYFFAKRIRNPQAELVWPEDGAIVSPVYMLIKKEKTEEHKPLLDFLFSHTTGEMLTGRNFPATHPDVAHDSFPETVKWLGWDFLNQQDIGQLKEDIRSVFLKVWEDKTTKS